MPIRETPLLEEPCSKSFHNVNPSIVAYSCWGGFRKIWIFLWVTHFLKSRPTWALQTEHLWAGMGVLRKQTPGNVVRQLAGGLLWGTIPIVPGFASLWIPDTRAAGLLQHLLKFCLENCPATLVSEPVLRLERPHRGLLLSQGPQKLCCVAIHLREHVSSSPHRESHVGWCLWLLLLTLG